jgi:hypothetical protein
MEIDSKVSKIRIFDTKNHLDSFVDSVISKTVNRLESEVFEIQSIPERDDNILTINSLDKANLKEERILEDNVSSIFRPNNYDDLPDLYKKLNKYIQTKLETISKEQKENMESLEKRYRLYLEYLNKVYENFSKGEVSSNIEHYNNILNKLEHGDKDYLHFSLIINSLNSKLSNLP